MMLGKSPAPISCGQVMHGPRMILASWCSDECMYAAPSKRGCFGEWDGAMPLAHTGKLAVKTACTCGLGCLAWDLDHPVATLPRRPL